MAKNQLVICDTNIFINFFKGHEPVKKELEKIGVENIAYSIITYSEIIYGTSKAKLPGLKEFFKQLKELHIDEGTSKIFKAVTLSHSFDKHIKIPDAFIASSALRHNLPLYTENKKDFDFIEGLKLYK